MKQMYFKYILFLLGQLYMLIFSYVVNLLGSAFFLQCGPVRILSKTTHDKSSKTSYRKLKLNGYFRKCMVISLLLLLTLSDFIFSVGGTLFSNTVELLVPLSDVISSTRGIG